VYSLCKNTLIGSVEAQTEDEALELAFDQFAIPERSRFRIVVVPE
jgi:hypothetical protein